LFNFAIVLSTAVSIYLSGWIAERRGRSVKLWCWLGAIFGPFATLAVALLPPVRESAGTPRGGSVPEPARSSEPSRRTASAGNDEPHGLVIGLA
jgi:hypothetical protein